MVFNYKYQFNQITNIQRDNSYWDRIPSVYDMNENTDYLIDMCLDMRMLSPVTEI
jgi:hypothetical protein